MSRLNPHVASFPATGSRASNASSPNDSTFGHTSNASKSYANPTKPTSYATRAQSEIDLTHITPSKADFTWPRGQVLPPITSSPSYGQRWNSTFPSPRKSYLPRSNAPILSPQRSPVIRRSKSPSLPQLNSAAPFGNLIMEHAGVNSRVAPLPTHTMTGHHSPPIKTRFDFEPFADDDDLLKEAANARVATSPAPLSPARVESVSWKFAADTNILREDDEDIGHSRNGMSSALVIRKLTPQSTFLTRPCRSPSPRSRSLARASAESSRSRSSTLASCRTTRLTSSLSVPAESFTPADTRLSCKLTHLQGRPADT